MSATTPAVSVSMITFNHERFISQAIRSVLDQTFADLELIVVDDGSTDGTADAIAAFTDPRIRSIRQENAGPGAASNTAIAAARGQYVAIMSGDDICHPERIEKQIAEYRLGPARVLFSAVDFINEDGLPCSDGHFAEDHFDFASLGQEQILTRFFDKGNFLNAVTCFTEPHVLRAGQPFDPLLFQLQDFELWLWLVKRYPLCIMQEKLVHYRIRNNNQNLSSPTPEHRVRNDNEYLFIMRRFFEDVTPDLFRTAFGPRLLRPDCTTPIEMACEQAFLFLRAAHPAQQVIGIERLYSLLSDPEATQVLKNRYGYSLLHFVAALRNHDLFGQLGPQTATLFVDSGHGFNENQLIRQNVNPLQREFALTFDMTAFPSVRQVRWDPLEMRHCRIWLDEAHWRDRAGTTGSIRCGALRSNGTQSADRSYWFETPDPMLILPVEGNLVELRLCGQWEVLDYGTSFTRTHAQLVAAQEQVLSLSGETSTLYLDTGRGFNEDEACRKTISLLEPDFALTYNLSSYPSVRQMRWDPFEKRQGRITLEEICWRDRSGKLTRLDTRKLDCNGVCAGDGSYSFESLDPMFILPIEGNAVELQLRGRWETLDLCTAFERTHGRLMVIQQQLEHRDREIHELMQRVHQLEAPGPRRGIQPVRWILSARNVFKRVLSHLRKTA